jgi:predicted nuclease with TOPRIM domain
MNFKEQDKILELKGENIILNEKYNKKKKEYDELLKKYVNLRSRYMKQNDELTQLTVLMSKEGYFENKH